MADFPKKPIQFMDVAAEKFAILIDEELREKHGICLTVDAWETLAWEFEKSIEKVVMRPEHKNLTDKDHRSECKGLTPKPLKSCIVCHKEKS